MFQMLSEGNVEAICGAVKKHKLTYGFGGVARLNDGTLPGRMIIAEHYRLGSEMVILSRSFCDASKTPYERLGGIFAEGMRESREYEKAIAGRSSAFFEENRKKVAARVGEIARNIESRCAVCI
jgi:hypothetical protein